MARESNRPVHSLDPSADLEVLRALCERQGVTPADADLEAVQGFLRAILPALEELERLVPDEISPLP